MVFCAYRRLFITAGRDGAVKVWRVRGATAKDWNTQLTITLGDGNADRPVVAMAAMMAEAGVLL
jgi:hypothetical protein